MDIKDLKIKVKCSACREETQTNSKGVSLKDITIDGKKYTITYIKCKICGKDLVVQIDDEYTKRILLECKSIIMAKVKAKKKMKHFSDKKNKLLNKLQQQLKNKRYDLANYLHQKPYYDVENKVVISSLDCSFVLDGRKEAKSNEE